jgi:acetolactate synthase-1/2/3 large subunit
MMRAVDAIMECLKAEGVDVVFGYPGGANLPTYDAFVDAGIRHVLVRHEAGGGHAAEGYAKASGKVGVVFATSGPGATNIVTPLTDAMMDSVPLVAFTGQVRTELLGTDGFQEADTFGITMPIVKHSFVIQHPAEIPRVVHEAFHIARSGRPGPVLIDIPQDLSRAEIDYQPVEDVHLPGYQPTLDGNSKQIRLAAKALANARRPVLYAGGGVVNAGASAELTDLTLTSNVPITCTLMGLGAFPAQHPQWLGMLGMHGTRAANYAMDEADLIVAIGARFDDRITGKLSEFAPRAKFIHIDIDPAEISKNVPAHIPIVGDAKRVLARLVGEYRALEPDATRLAGWWDRIEHWRATHPLRYEDTPDTEIKPQFLGRRVHPVLGRRPAPDVGGSVLPVLRAAALDQLGRAGHDGLRAAGRDRRRDRRPRAAVRAADRRRLVPDEHPGARDRAPVRRAGQVRDHGQRLPRHGPPVAGALLGPALLERRHGPVAGLDQARRRLRGDRRAADRQDDVGG